MAKAPTAGGTAKHVAATKHRHRAKASTKHHPTHVKKAASALVKAKKKTVHKAGFSPDLPVCVPQAFAASLYLATGYKATEDELLSFFYNCQHSDSGIKISEGLERLMEIGLADFQPESYSITGKIEPGTIIGTYVPGGYHAITQGEANVFTWGKEIPLRYFPEEIWTIDWHRQ